MQRRGVTFGGIGLTVWRRGWKGTLWFLCAVQALAGCSRFTYKTAADPLLPLWPQLGGGASRNAIVAAEPLLPLETVLQKQASGAIQPSLIGLGNWILFTTGEGRIGGFELRTGKRIGKTIGRSTTPVTCAAGDSGLAIIRRLRRDNILFYDLARGRVRWKKSTEPILGEPLIVGERLYLATLRGRLLCLALKDGALIAEARLPHDCLAAPAMADSVLAIGDDRGVLHAFDPQLRPLWHLETGGALRAPAVALGGSFFIGSTSGRFSAIDIRSGIERWHYLSPGKILHAAAAADSLVIVAASDTQLCGLDIRDGRLLWRTGLGAVPATAPLICGRTLFLAAGDTKMRAFALDNGRELWSFATKTAISTHPIVIGRLFLFGTANGLLYAFTWR
ncbi:MAG TPA: PQQ-binding-like beta-propeller repeat protein [bacterium]|nr:PQQ-binding-like beta-propeller repeat protein [bacterium]HQI47290.1 PQQ-binding-like beta-propeller repeat protein [bacterium]HQJ63777.1 PQQ-binding-like beta-propeller repeat protein [bacterium]